MSERIFFVAHGGRVQGVGFRYFTRERAREYGITGWCRNTPDNKVEGEVQGPSEDVKKILKDINEGPRHSHVVKLSTENRDLIEDETEFKVRH